MISFGHFNKQSNKTNLCITLHLYHIDVFVPKLFHSDSVWPRGQTPLSMGFSRQEYWIGLPCPPPGDLPDPGIELASLASPVLTGGFFTTTWGAPPHGCVLVAQSCPTLWNPTDCSPPGSSVHGKDTGVDCHALLQGIFLAQGPNLRSHIAGRFFTSKCPRKPHTDEFCPIICVKFTWDHAFQNRNHLISQPL